MNEENNTDFDAEKSEDFYRKLRGKMSSWLEGKGSGHEWAGYLMFAPDLFYTLVKMMTDPDVSTTDKAKLAGVIAYFISPIDLVPEAVVGPIGFIDDIVLAAYVLNGIVNESNEEVIKRNWPGDGEVLDVIKMILEKASKFLGGGLLDKLLKKKSD